MKAASFVDGFNLYFAITKSFTHSKYKWLNLRKLAERYLEKGEELKQVLYFSAYAFWDPEKVRRHKTYIAALSASGCDIILGKFKTVSKTFVKSKMQIVSASLPEAALPERMSFKTFEEKETDVNIAVKMIELASSNQYGHFYIVSGDSDFLPAIKYIKRTYRSIKFTNILPINGKGISLGQVCDEQVEMNEEDLKTSLLADQVPHGVDVISRPIIWK